jgi:hypothetical protein
VPSEIYAGSYSGSASTYGWQHLSARVLNGRVHLYPVSQIIRNVQNINTDGHVYTITLNCDEYRISMINESNGEQDEIEVDVRYAPLPWCLFVGLPHSTAAASLI